MVPEKLTYLALAVFLALGLDARAEVPVRMRMTVFDVERTMRADGGRGPYRLSDRAIATGGESVWVDGKLQARDLDYLMDSENALLTFFKEVPRGTPIVIRFRQAPRVLQPVYRRRLIEGGENAPEGRLVPSEKAVSGVEEPRLAFGGAKRVQVAFGSDRDHTLTQSLQMHISGEVAEGVELLALLSDRNLPLSGDGRTRGIQELDRVFFQVRSGSVAAGLGDLDVLFDRTEFGRYRRRLQGANLSLNRSEGEVEVFGAVSKGRWVTRRVVAVEGYQGPYRLGTARGVVAGSERVYLNGQMLRRGEGQDYVVDYDRGFLTFTPSRPVRGESRITVEYQYLADGLRRRLVGVQSLMKLGADRGHLGATFIRESDQAFAGVPLSGHPGARHQVTVVDGAYAPVAGLRLTGELAFSNRQGASVPSKGDRALQVGMDWAPEGVRLAGRSLGRARLSGSFRRVGAGFEGFERLDRVGTEGRWGWRPEAERGEEQSGEMGFEYAFREGVVLGLGYGRRAGSYPAGRREAALRISEPGWPEADYRFEQITQGRGQLARQSGRIQMALGGLQPGFRFRVERATGEAVRMSSLYYATLPGEIPEGVQSGEFIWDLSAGRGEVWTWHSELTRRLTRTLSGAWQDSLRGWSHRHRAQLMNWQGMNLSGEYSGSRVRSPRAGANRNTHLARVQLGYQLPGGGFTQQISYRISSTGVLDQKRVFVEVGRGLGTHIWEDVDGDGLRDPEEFVPDVDGDYELLYSVGGQFQPAREGALGARFEVVFKRFLSQGVWARFLKGVSLDVSLEADRQVLPGAGGVAPWQLQAFVSGPEVLTGRRDLRARVYFFRYHRRASLQVSARKRDRLNRILTGSGLEHQDEVVARGRYRLGRRFDWETTVRAERRHRVGEGLFAYRIGSRFVENRGIWRPSRGWQARVGVGLGKDREQARNLNTTYVSLNPEVIRSLPGRGRVRGSLDWTRVNATDSLPLFLGMAGGNRAGQNVAWRLGVDYRLGKYVTALAAYDGRRRPGRPTIHLGRVEVRAIF